MSAAPHSSDLIPSTKATDQATRTPLYVSAHVPPLRVACVVPSWVPMWMARLQELASEHDWLEWIAVPVKGLASPEEPDVSPVMRALLRYERSRRAAQMDAFTATRMVADADMPSIGGEADLAGVTDRLKALAPDLIVALVPEEWAQPLAECAPRGCWRIDQNLANADAAAQALLPPLLRADEATAVELQLAGDGASARRLATSWGTTRRVSVSEQCEQAFRKLPALLIRGLRQLQEGILEWPSSPVQSLRLNAAPLPAGHGVRAVVSTLIGRAQWRWRQYRQPHEDPWFVAIRHDEQALRPEQPTMPRYSALVADDSLGAQIWADPCAVEEAGRRLLFVEECTSEARMAHIACIEVPPQGPARRLGIVLNQAHHLSFPQVFRWDGHWYMTVESGQARCVTLYRVQEFPLVWQPAAELIHGRHCVDPVLHYHDGHWFLFVNVAESGGSTWDELFLFVAESLAGPFVAHPANPIVADVRRARSAGRLFERDGKLIRPAQDCTPCYGAATVFNEVLELSPTGYRERPLGRLDASWSAALDGCHTYSASDNLEAVDARGHLPAAPMRLPVIPARPW